MANNTSWLEFDYATHFKLDFRGVLIKFRANLADQPGIGNAVERDARKQRFHVRYWVVT